MTELIHLLIEHPVPALTVICIIPEILIVSAALAVTICIRAYVVAAYQDETK